METMIGEAERLEVDCKSLAKNILKNEKICPLMSRPFNEMSCKREKCQMWVKNILIERVNTNTGYYDRTIDDCGLKQKFG